ncbi:MAG TPA: FtsX-like permease family protein, partial [Gammaproteobacteria bacterium]|nr:FtsX-like permease family protein [Gammaproteobacteria bacterium]
LGDRTATILLLQGAVLLILLMTCVNVANLLLSRVLGRGHEIAMRSALGASRRALARQLLIESICLAVPGGLAGVALGWLGLRFFAQPALTGSGSIFDMTLDWRVGLAALVMVGVTAALVSVLPIRHLAKTDLQSLLQAGGRSAGGGIGARRVRSALVATELTLATLLLAASGLLLHSFINLEAVNPGFRQNDVLIAGLLVPDNDHTGDAALGNYYRALLQHVRALPGVQAAGIGLWLPMGHNLSIQTFDIRGRERPPGHTSPTAAYDLVGGGYFSAMGMPILRGRGFDSRDTANSLPVVIIDSHLAKQYFDGADPLGQQLKFGDTWYSVVGVVPSVKLQHLANHNHATVYLNAFQVPARDVRLAIHTSIPPELLTQSLRKAAAAVDPSVAVYGVETMRERLADSLHDQQATMMLLLAFGGIALALAVVGVYGVLSYAVGQRVTECGVRLALGALPGDLLWLIIRDGLKLLTVGLVTGLVLAVIAGYVLSSRLFGVVPFDPLTLIGSALVLSGITLIACYLPARRAAKLDPAVAIVE